MKSSQASPFGPRAGLTIAELLIIIVILFVIVIMILPATPWQEIRDRAGCQSNLKKMATVYRMYTDEAAGNFYPTRAPFSLSPDAALMYPDYMTDFDIWACPASREAQALLWPYSANPWYNHEGEVRLAEVQLLGDQAYTYFGFHFSENTWTEPETPIEWPIAKAARDPHFEERRIDHPNEEISEQIWLRRLHPNVAKEMNEAGAFDGGAADLPVMWDGITSRTLPGPPYTDDLIPKKKFDHFEFGVNVLYLDGHVEYREFGNDFPFPEQISRVELYTMIQWQNQGPGAATTSDDDESE